MILVLLALGAVLLVLPGLYRTPPDRLPLEEWVPIATAALTVGALSVEAGLVLLALPTIAHGVGLASIADACHQVLAPFSTAPGLLGWAAAGGALTIATRFALGIRRARVQTRQARAEPWLGTHDHREDFDLVVVPTSALLAFGAPGNPPQVVLSQGLVDLVPAASLEAVVHHEAAHHRLKHGRYATLLTGLERALGSFRPVRQGAATIRAALEAWADAAASRDPSTRCALRRALVEVGGPNHSDTSDRSQRLLRRAPAPPRMVRAFWYSPVALLMTAAGLVLVGWLADAHPAMAMGAACGH